jgi:aldose 1-epimerase
MAGITQREYGRLADGRPVAEYTLDNGRGLRLCAIEYGGIVTALHVPDRDGRSANVVLGLPTLAEYVAHNPHFGTIVGRYGNRIAHGRFTLDGIEHRLDLNDGPNSLHGGAQGFGTRLWQAEPLPVGADGEVSLEVVYTSAEGEGGYPGELAVTVRYTLTPNDEWRIDYRAATRRATVLNLTHHDYFNLAGSGSVLGHELTLAASRYTPIDRHLIPIGVADVAGTPFDFREPVCIDDRIREAHEQLLLARGYDHNFVLDRRADGLALAARLQDPASGRVMEVHTPPSPACSSIRAIFSMAAWSARRGRPTGKVTGCASKRSTSPIHRTGRNFRPRCCGPARCSAARRCIDSCSRQRTRSGADTYPLGNWMRLGSNALRYRALTP